MTQDVVHMIMVIINYTATVLQIFSSEDFIGLVL